MWLTGNHAGIVAKASQTFRWRVPHGLPRARGAILPE